MPSACRFDRGIERAGDGARRSPSDAAGLVVPVVAGPRRAVRQGCRGVAGRAWTLPADCRLAAIKFSRTPSSGWCPRMGRRAVSAGLAKTEWPVGGADYRHAAFTEKPRRRGQCLLPGGSARALATQSHSYWPCLFCLGLRGCERQFGAGNSRRGPITEAWARRGRCLPLAALTRASDAQETVPGGVQAMWPGW